MALCLKRRVQIATTSSIVSHLIDARSVMACAVIVQHEVTCSLHVFLTLSDHGAGSPELRNCHWIIVIDVDLSQEETIDGYAYDHAFDSYPRRITVFVASAPNLCDLLK